MADYSESLRRAIRDARYDGAMEPKQIHEAVDEILRRCAIERCELRVFTLTNIKLYSVDVYDPALNEKEVREAWNFGDIPEGEEIEGHIEIELAEDHTDG